jgi:hypothetical protein
MLLAGCADTTAVVSITTEGEIVHTIPAKFLNQYTIEYTLADSTVAEFVELNGGESRSPIIIPEDYRDILWENGKVRIKVIDTSSDDFVFANVDSWQYVNGAVTLFAHCFNGYKFTFDVANQWTPPTTPNPHPI